MYDAWLHAAQRSGAKIWAEMKKRRKAGRKRKASGISWVEDQ